MGVPDDRYVASLGALADLVYLNDHFTHHSFDNIASMPRYSSAWSWQESLHGSLYPLHFADRVAGSRREAAGLEEISARVDLFTARHWYGGQKAKGWRT